MCLTTVESREGVVATNVVAGVIPVATVISVHVIYHVTHGQNTATDANHQAKFNGRKSGDHPRGDGRCWVCADFTFGQASYNNIVLANGPESVRVGIIWRL